MRRIHRDQDHTLTTRRTIRRDRYYRRKLLVYARNMVQTLDLTEDLLHFVIPLLPQRSKFMLRKIMTTDNDTAGDSVPKPGSNKAIVARIIEISELPDGDSMVARIQKELQRLLALAVKSRKYAPLPAGGLAVKRVFGLKRQELELLMTVVAYQVNRELERYLDELSGTSKVSSLSAMTGLSVAEVMSCGAQHGKLVRCGLIEHASLSETHRFFQANELLTQMENHHGILICCSNLMDNLDHAVIRRFAMKVRLSPLDINGRLKLFRKYFPTASKNMSDQDLRSKLKNIPQLTPGDISVVSLRYRMRTEKPLDETEILSALADEAAYHKKRGGIIGFGPSKNDQNVHWATG